MNRLLPEEALNMFFKGIEDPESLPEPEPGPHGKIIERRCEAFYDVTVYEDGYEDRYYLGD